MKAITVIFTMVLFTLGICAQDGQFAVSYGINLSEVYTGSGHGASYEVNSNIQKGRKSLEIGMIFQDQDKRLSGGNAKYRVFLGKNKYSDSHLNSRGIAMKPYLHYNCIYQSSKVNTPDFIPVGSKKSSYPELPSSPGTIASMEHYTGAGVQVFVAKNICIDGSFGFGTYIGALDHFNSPNTLGIHNENSGFVFSFDFGIGYKFGI